MPTNHVSAEKMDPGGKSGGKHWTKAEVESRKAAAEMVKRKAPVVLRAPKWLSREAKKVWNQVKKEVADLDLLDNLDTHTLAVYCDAVIKYQDLSQKEILSDDDVKLMQSWARIIAGYADKLGFTPAARARLVKKKADEILDEFGQEFDA